MATSGQLNTNTTYDSYFWVKWEQVGNQDVANNRTQIKWTCGLYSTHMFYSNAVKMSAVTINGTQVFGGGTYSNFTAEGNQTIASGTMWINHSADGTKTFSIGSFTGWLYSNNNYSCNGGSYSLTAIPRQANIISAPDFTDLDNPTITYSNPAGNAVDELRACISFTGAKDDIAYRDISKTGSSYTFDLDKERDKLRDNTEGTKREVIFFVRTVISGAVYYSTLKKTLTIVESEYTKPTVYMSASLNNESLPSNFDCLYVQGKSKVGVNLSADGKNGATIQSYSAVVDGKTYGSNDFTSDVVQNTGSIKITGYAKDSRGFTGSTEATIDNVLAYSKPLVIPLSGENAIKCYRSDENGKMVGDKTSVWIKAKITYYDVAGENNCSLQWRSKEATHAWDDSKHKWLDLISNTTTTSNEYNAMVSGTFDLEKAYTIQIRAIDTVGEYDIKTCEIPTRDVALHLGKGGKNVAIGTYCDYSQARTFYSDWVGIFDKGLLGTSLNNNVTDVLTFAEECIDGLTPIIINESTNKANLPDGNYAYSVGIIHKRAADQYNVVLMDYVTGKIAINVYLSGTWTGWKYITPQ